MLLLPIITTVGGYFVTLSSQRAFIVAIAFLASLFCISALDMVVRCIIRPKQEVLIVVGDSVGYDCVVAALLVMMMYVVYHTQKKVGQDEELHV